ncbi:MAG: 3-oxoacyl-[acyl-carrier-protein] reductase [Bdellovibrionales bacterium]|nr:3-oxoacyl-[acyl-carrier-protein] reductase [Bdellovibrionales bacterium]
MTQEKRIVLITGASRGIGRAIAIALAHQDHHVIVNYRSQKEAADEVVAQITSKGLSASSLGFDVADNKQVEAAMETITREFGGVDVLVNNAGIPLDGLLLRYKDEDFDQSINVNLKGAYLCSKAALKSMMKRKKDGRIVMMSSVVGQMGNAGQTVYAATKAGLIGFAKSLAREVASRQITVNVIAPGFVETEMTGALTDAQKEAMLNMIPLKRYASPSEIASVVAFLVSKDSGYITGQTIAVNGGMYL